mmetsp:Transcript_40663/g.91410  ORF Transcript_40663/g.91410 Transcript_40663/m.91410 type:complete len:421 (-) Transcript_40663:183-1445(-)
MHYPIPAWPPRYLLELLLEERGEVLGHLERLGGHVDGGHALGRLALEHRRAHPLLEGHVVRVLEVEVGHPVRVLGLLGRHERLELRVGRHGPEHLVARRVAHHRLGVAAARLVAAPVRVHAHRLTLGRGHREADLVEVGKVLAAVRALERLARGVPHVGLHLGDVVAPHAVVSDEERQLVHRHVLKHALRVALEALGELLLLVSIVVVKFGAGSGAGRLLGFERRRHVGGHVFVVAHEDGHALALGVGRHRLQLPHRRGPGLLEEHGGGPGVDHLLEQPGVVGGPARDERHLLPPRGGRLHRVDRRVELDSLGLPLLDQQGEGRARGGVLAAAEEPGLDHVGKAARPALALHQLVRVVPAHATSWEPAAHHNVVRHGGLGGHGGRRLRGSKSRRPRPSEAAEGTPDSVDAQSHGSGRCED